MPTLWHLGKCSNSNHINDLKIGLLPAFTHGAAIAAEAESDDTHTASNRAEPDPEKPSSHVAHLDVQHWLDDPAFSRARGPLRHALRWLLWDALTRFRAGHKTTADAATRPAEDADSNATNLFPLSIYP
jgi:hypothetical protein